MTARVNQLFRPFRAGRVIGHLRNVEPSAVDAILPVSSSARLNGNGLASTASLLVAGAQTIVAPGIEASDAFNPFAEVAMAAIARERAVS